MPWGTVSRSVRADAVVLVPEGASPVGVVDHPLNAAFPSRRDTAASVGGFSRAPLPILGNRAEAGIPGFTEGDSDMFTPWYCPIEANPTSPNTLAMETGFTDCEWVPPMLTTRTMTSPEIGRAHV